MSNISTKEGAIEYIADEFKFFATVLRQGDGKRTHLTRYDIFLLLGQFPCHEGINIVQNNAEWVAKLVDVKSHCSQASMNGRKGSAMPVSTQGTMEQHDNGQCPQETSANNIYGERQDNSKNLLDILESKQVFSFRNNILSGLSAATR